jgi:hypothetical protein
MEGRMGKLIVVAGRTLEQSNLTPSTVDFTITPPTFPP